LPAKRISLAMDHYIADELECRWQIVNKSLAKRKYFTSAIIFAGREKINHWRWVKNAGKKSLFASGV
jgi:hypothetical protein